MTAATLNLDPAQFGHAQTIINTVQARGLDTRAAIITIETAIVESTIHVYANSNVPESLNLPHEGVGSDHLSVGIFQQQTPMWGTVADCMDPATSCGLFLDRLVGFDYHSMPTGQAAQTVQVSAFPDRYQQQEGWATQIVNALWGGGTSPDSSNVHPLAQEDDMPFITVPPKSRGQLPVVGYKSVSMWTEDGGVGVRAAVRNTSKAVRPLVTAGAPVSDNDHFQFWLGAKQRFHVGLQDGDWGIQFINTGDYPVTAWTE